jgi:hypothetical protein
VVQEKTPQQAVQLNHLVEAEQVTGLQAAQVLVAVATVAVVAVLEVLVLMADLHPVTEELE